MKVSRLALIALAFIGPGSVAPNWIETQTATAQSSLLARQYREGERLAYRMTASNRDRTRTTVYSAIARGVVKRDEAGTFFEEYEWGDVVWNGTAFDLPEVNRGFRQRMESEAAVK